MTVDWNAMAVIVSATITAVPAFIAARNSRVTRQQTKNVGNGFASTVLTRLQKIENEAKRTARRLDEHIAASNGRVRERHRPHVQVQPDRRDTT